MSQTAHQYTKKELWHLAIVLFPLGCYALFIGNKSMPISEGWYSALAAQINQGYVPYRDFDLLFPPLYSYIITIFTSCFGYKIVFLRYFGVIIFLFTAAIAYLVFRHFFNRPSSVVATLVSMIFLQSGNAEVFYDYIYFFNLFAYISILFMLNSLQQSFSLAASTSNLSHPRSPNLSIFLAGLFASLALQIKQSAGACLFFATLICLFGINICAKMEGTAARNLRLNPLLYSAGILMPLLILAIYLFLNGTFTQFISCCFSGALGAKGGSFGRLILWPIDNVFLIIRYLPMPIALILASEILKKSPSTGAVSKTNSRFIDVLISFSSCFVLAIMVLICYLWETLSRTLSSNYDANQLVFASFLYICIMFFRYLYLSIRNRVTGHTASPAIFYRVAFFSSALAIALGVIVSGGLASSQVSLGLGFSLGMLFESAASSKIEPPHLLASLGLVYLIFSFCISVRYVNLYYWWGLSEGSIWEQTASSDAPLLDGLHMSNKTADVYNGIYQVFEHVPTDTTLFCFPHCPIFYCLTDLNPSTKSIVQWFDVSLPNTLESDFARLLESPPDYLLICDIPAEVIQSHVTLFGTYWTGDMYNSLLKLASDRYTELRSFDLQGGYVVHLYKLNSMSL